MGRRAKLRDHGPKVHEIRECVSIAEAEVLWVKYRFRNADLFKSNDGSIIASSSPAEAVRNFYSALNEVLSWRDTFQDSEERPAGESAKIVRAVNNGARSLLNYIGKPGADIPPTRLLRSRRR